MLCCKIHLQKVLIWFPFQIRLVTARYTAATLMSRGPVHASYPVTVQFSTQEQLLRRNVKRFRGGLVFKAHRLVYHSTQG